MYNQPPTQRSWQKNGWVRKNGAKHRNIGVVKEILIKTKNNCSCDIILCLPCYGHIMHSEDTATYVARGDFGSKAVFPLKFDRGDIKGGGHPGE